MTKSLFGIGQEAEPRRRCWRMQHLVDRNCCRRRSPFAAAFEELL
jgi:hypothetical protein